MALADGKILIIEDEESVVKLLTETLSKEGFTVFVAKDGKEGLETALKEIPNLILLDIIMPTMNGMEMLEKLRNNDIGRKIPVIVLTNVGDTAEILAAQKLGIDSYLIKTNTKLQEVTGLIKSSLGISS